MFDPKESGTLEEDATPRDSRLERGLTAEGALTYAGILHEAIRPVDCLCGNRHRPVVCLNAGVIAVDANRYVRDLMSQPVKTLGPNDTLALADSTMRSERVRHLPVVDDGGRVVGILSQRDLFFNGLVRALGFGTTTRDRTLNSILVKEAMTPDVVTTAPDTPVRSAAQLMVDRKIGCLPVLEGEVLIGMLSESDVVLAVARGTL